MDAGAACLLARAVCELESVLARSYVLHTSRVFGSRFTVPHLRTHKILFCAGVGLYMVGQESLGWTEA